MTAECPPRPIRLASWIYVQHDQRDLAPVHAFRIGVEHTDIGPCLSEGPRLEKMLPTLGLGAFANGRRGAYIWPMSKFDFCLPTTGKVVPSSPDWFHDIKFDGYRLRLERDVEP